MFRKMANFPVKTESWAL